jgi:adenine phosphoribosyltransferase
VTTSGRDAVRDLFRWEQGHADIWRVLADPDALRSVIEGLAAPWANAGVTHVLGIESRGFLLGGATAVGLGAGFVAVRKSGTGLLPGPKVQTTTDSDYRGLSHRLRMQAVLGPQDAVLMVDDWAERGSQAVAARALVERCGARWLGLSLVVDQLSEDKRGALGRVTALVGADELGPADASSCR